MAISQSEVDLFDKVVAEMRQLHAELSLLSKSKPDNPINRFKLRHINDKLTDANQLLVNRYKPLKGFETFDEDDMPTNSDVVLVVSQYLEGLEGWRSTHVVYDGIHWNWDTDEPHNFPAQPPTRFRRGK